MSRPTEARPIVRAGPIDRLRGALAIGLIYCLVSGCNQSIDLTPLRALGPAMDAQEQADAAISSDFYASCQRQITWRAIAIVEPHLRGQVALTAAQSAAIGKAKALLRQTDAEILVLSARLQGMRSTGAKQASAKLRTLELKRDAQLGKLGALKAAVKLIAPSTARRLAARVYPQQPVPVPHESPPIDPCHFVADASADWQHANLIVTTYVRALSRLAGGGANGDTGAGLSSLVSTLKGAGALTGAQAPSIASLGKALEQDAVAFQDRNAIAETAPKAEGSLDEVITQLEYVANVDYSKMLSNEADAINAFYSSNFRSTASGLQALESVKYLTAWKAQLDVVQARRAAIGKYVASLEALKDAHKAISDRIANGQSTGYVAIISAYVSEYTPLVKGVVEANQSNSNLDPPPYLEDRET